MAGIQENVSSFQRLRKQWSMLSLYEKFEQIVSINLILTIAVIIVMALGRLMFHVYHLMAMGAFDPLHHEVFKEVFGMIMTLLIAMEFKHSILEVAIKGQSIIQVKTVVLIALLALTRKFIILDVKQMSAPHLAALAFSVLVLGLVYWLMRERDDRVFNRQQEG